MKKIIYLLSFILFSCSSNAQSCYEISLKKIKVEIKNKDFQTALFRLESLKETCTDIPTVNALDSIQSFLREKLKKDTVKITAPKELDSLVWKQNIATNLKKYLQKKIGQKDSLFSFVTKYLLYDFNKDNKKELIVLYSYKKNKDSSYKETGIAIYKTNLANYTLKTESSFEVTKDCFMYNGDIDQFKELLYGIFIFEAKDPSGIDDCVDRIYYDVKKNKLIKL
jgi:hypothetical protein